jgi:serine protease Do
MADENHTPTADLDLLDALGRVGAAGLARLGPATVAVGRDDRGAGLVVAPDRVLTNAHNLRDRTTQVTLADGRRVQGAVVGADPQGDLVVLEVPTADAPAVTWSGAPPVPGQAVFSVARSHRGPRIALGLVSGVDRVLRGPGGRELSGAIEHGAALGRGATGGALVAPDGTVLGVNTHRLPTGSVLALAADDALTERVARMAGGQHVRRPALGVAVAGPDVAARLRRSVGLDERSGLLVREVDDDGPAAAAGIRPGDLLVRAGDTDLDRPAALVRALDAVDPDGVLALSVVRGVEELELEVDLSNAPSGRGTAAG